MGHLRYLYKLVRFAFRANPLFYLALGLAVFSVFVELAAMTSLFPLAALAAGTPIGSDRKIVRVLAWLGLAPTLRTFLQVFIVLFMVRIVTQLLTQGLTIRLSKRLQAQLSSRAFSVFMKDLRIEDFERRNIGYFITLGGDEASRASVVVNSLLLFVSQFVLAVLYLGTIFVQSWPTGVAVVAFLAITFLSLLGLLRQTQQLGARKTEENRAYTSVFVDGLNGIKAVRALAAEDFVTSRYRGLVFQYTRTLFQADFLATLIRTLPVLILLGLFLAFTLLANGFFSRSINVGFYVTILLFLLRFFPVVGQCLNILMAVLFEARTGRDVTTIVENPPAPSSDLMPFDEPVQRIHFDNVSFSYESKADVLIGVNLEFQRGKSYAILGPSGIGKSTVVDLLLKFYAIREGTIWINQRRLNSVNERDLRTRVTLLGQQTTIFDDSVLNNVRFGLDADDAEVERACRLACVHDAIMELPEGYQTRLQYQGSNLSGGQRQRIGLARALLRRSDVLILDEGTSALDQETRDEVLSNILADCADSILIFVTHDPAVAQRVDRVIDFESINRVEVPLDHV